MSIPYFYFSKDIVYFSKGFTYIIYIESEVGVLISYAPLMATLHKKKMSKTDLQKLINVSSATIAKISKDEFISMKVIDDICETLNCSIEDVIVHIQQQKDH
ncbi:helix-turn-helix domain-containing protein [Bacillus sp. OTU530]|uniref:helix-turn-helix domain-containing protein n=1 Tax=Bacillus sp. OTU530 TaxID=3043862 RepID=UPI00313A9286